MKEQILEQGILITPCSEETNQYVSYLMQFCKKHQIDYSSATEKERAFVLDSVNELMKKREAR